MVEWGALEKRCGREVTVGSNPTLSAPKGQSEMAVLFCFIAPLKAFPKIHTTSIIPATVQQRQKYQWIIFTSRHSAIMHLTCMQKS